VARGAGRLTRVASPPSSVTAIEAFAAETFAAFESACAALAPDDRPLRLAGHDVLARFAAPNLAPRFEPALAHLGGPLTGAPDLTIGCWEREATGVLPPPPPWDLDDFLSRGRIRGQFEGPVRVAYEEWARTLTVYDREHGRAVVYTGDAAVVPRWFDRAPFRSVLTWWAVDRGLPLLHASGVADDHGAVAIAGASGAGKSTTALACLDAGLRLVGDDACLVRLDPAPTVFSIYARAKLEPDALARLPALGHLIVDRHDEQALIDPGPRRAESAPLQAVLLPTITHERATRVTPVDARDAVKLLVRSTVQEGIGVVSGALASITRLVRTVPCRRLELGTDLGGVVAAVRDVLEER
jgi:hypothetical protein